MYTGVTSYLDARRVDSYETAKAALERASLTPTGKRRTAKTYGFHLGQNRNYGVTWVRECADGAIAFRLYDTDVVTWHPDGSVEIENFGTVATSAFASRFLPAGIHLHHRTYRRGEEGGHNGVSFCPPGDSSWSGRLLCFGHGGGVTFWPVKNGEVGGYAPDPDTLSTITFPELDRKRAGELSRHYNLREFNTYLAMAPRHMRIEHDHWDYHACTEALEARDFRRAAETVPLVEGTSAYGREIVPLPVVTRFWNRHVTTGSFERLKLAIYDREGAFTDTRFTTIGLDEFTRRQAKVRRMEALGGNYGYWGL